jgi:predicted MFS family arabinose efflux permease
MKMKLRSGHGFGWRHALFALAVMSLVTLCIAIGELPQIHENPAWRTITFFLLLPMCLAVTFTWPRTNKPPIQAAGILLLGLAARLALVSYPADSDDRSPFSSRCFPPVRSRCD